MEPRYKHLLSPLKVGNRVLKNRVLAGNSLPHFLQGPETYPADTVIAHFENKAKGASAVTCMGINNFTKGKQYPMDMDMGHFPDFDLYDCTSQNYLLQLADAIHFYNSMACMGIFVGPPSFYPLIRKQAEVVQGDFNGDTGDPEKPFDIPLLEDFELEQIPAHNPPDAYDEETLDKIADSYAEQAGILQMLDFDMVSLHFAYRANLPAKFFSPITNHRTDRWGGSLENRMRFPLMVLERIRQRVGKDFIVEMVWSAEDTDGGYSLEESEAFLREAARYIDIVQLRAPDVDPAHPTGFTLEETPFLHYAEHVKQHVDGLVVATIGGYQYLDTCEQAIAEGKTDLIYMSRGFISNPNLWQLLEEGRGEDVVPCLRCNKCHGRGVKDPFQSVCSVNPIIGLEQKIDRMILPTAGGKRVAVIGGGVAGMRCAMDLADRGHQVDLYEASGALGGVVGHADFVAFKWPLRRFREFLVQQVRKRDAITVKLNTPATPEALRAAGYDTVVAAVGARPVLPPIPGLADCPNRCFAQQALERQDQLGHTVVIIGGGEVGVETGIYLAQQGHEVTVVEMQPILAPDATKIHYRATFEHVWLNQERFHFLVNTEVTAVTDGTVQYRTKDGQEGTLPFDSLVVSAGMAANTDEALAFYGVAPVFHMIGDCKQPATVQQAMRSAFSTAMRI